MDTTPRTHITGLALAATILWVTLGASSPAAHAEPIEPLTSAQQELVAWAESRFEAAGLDFPTIDLFFHDDSSSCRRRVGLYFPRSRELHMCRLDRNTMLHELAHAWDYENLTDAERVAFASFRDLGSWNDHTQDWKERGAEHFAEMIVWALMDHDVTVTWTAPDDDGTSHTTRRLLSIPNSGPDQLADAYRLVFGDTPTPRTADAPRSEATDGASSPEAQRRG